MAENITLPTDPVFLERLMKKIRPIMEWYIKPYNILSYFHSYDEGVLVRKDIEEVEAVTNNHGNTAGASKLLERLMIYENWHICLLRVFKDPQVKLAHVASLIEKEIKQAADAEEPSLEIEVQQLKEKLQEAECKTASQHERIQFLEKEKQENESERSDLRLQLADTRKERDIMRGLALTMKRKWDQELESPAKKLKKASENARGCKCSKCPQHTWILKSVCCQELKDMLQIGHTGCLSTHIFFIRTICVEDALEIEFEEKIGESLFQPPQPRNYRYAAYRVFVRWAYGVIGLGNRVQIPACIEQAIRLQYPDY